MVQRKTMRMRSLIAFFLLVILSGLVAAKGARGGMSSRGGGYSSSRGGSSRPSGSSGSSGGGGWFSGKSGKSSAPAPAYKPPSYSPSANKAPSSGWNINANNNPSPSHTSGKFPPQSMIQEGVLQFNCFRHQHKFKTNRMERRQHASFRFEARQHSEHRIQRRKQAGGSAASLSRLATCFKNGNFN